MRRGIAPPARRQAEPTIALINIVFLMLIFFLIAGSIAPRPDPDIALVTLSGIRTEPPSDALVLLPDGSLRLVGEAVDLPVAVERLAGNDRVRLLPDRAAPAERLVAVAQAFRAAGTRDLVIVTEGGLP